MATNDIKAVSINTDGWSADVTVEGWSAEVGDIAYDYGTPESGSGNVTFTVVSEGYDSAGALGTVTRTVYGTKTVRQAYPNEASLDETVSVSDVVIRIALSECIYDDDKSGGAGTSGTDPTVTIAAGWATHSGTTGNNVATGLAVTNNSTLDYPKVIGQWDWANTPAWKRVESGFSVAFRARHGYGISAVALSATGVTSSNVDSSTVTTLSKTQHQNGLYTESYIHSVASLADFTQGENITLKAIAYPVVGDANSIIDTSTNTTATDDIKGLTQITCTCDKTGALKDYAVVTTTGDDGTGAKSTTLATADAAPFATIGKALASGATIVYVRTGTSYDILGADPVTVTARDYYIEVRPHPSDAASGIQLTRGGTFRTYTAKKLAYIGFTGNINYSAGNGWLDGEDLGNRVLFEDCAFVNSATPSVGNAYRSEGCWYIDCTGMGVDDYTDFSSSRVVYSFTGCSWSGDANGIVATTLIGNDTTADDLSLRFYEGAAANPAPLTDNVMIEHNQIMALDGGLRTLNYAESRAITNFSIIGNVIEHKTGGQQAVYLGADASTVAITNCVYAHNTVLGNRSNLCYNDAGTTAYQRDNVFVVGNVAQTYNIKTDTFGTPSGNRIGNWAQVYGVHFKDNRWDGTSGSTFINDYAGLNTSFVDAADATFGTIEYTDDASTDGTALGNGDYLPTDVELIGENTLLTYFSYDLYGNPANDDIGAVSTGTEAVASSPITMMTAHDAVGNRESTKNPG